MKSLGWVKENIDKIEEDNFIDRRFTKRFLGFIPVEEWGKYGFSLSKEAEIPVVKEWTKENVLEQLKKDTEFGIEKAVNHKGISASLMFSCVRGWCIVLENGLENSDYGWYGDKLFKAVDEMYDFGLVNEDTFDKDFYEEW